MEDRGIPRKITVPARSRQKTARGALTNGVKRVVDFGFLTDVKSVGKRVVKEVTATQLRKSARTGREEGGG